MRTFTQKTFRYISFTALAVTVLSCNDFLKEKPDSFIQEEEFYNTQNDAVSAVTSIYYSLNSGGTSVQTPYNTLFNTGMDFAGDDEDPGPGATNADVRSLSVLGHSASNLRVYEIWQQHYAAIRKANIVLAKVPDISFDETLKNRLLAEAKFLRALYYFNLVRLYGDVPLVIEYKQGVTAADYAIARTPSTEVYAQIEKDLLEAAAVLPVSYTAPDVGRATLGAALGLLAKVYLTKASLPLNITSHYADAVQTAEYVLSVADGGTGTYNGKPTATYNLVNDYSQVFLPAYKNGVEHIFSAQFKSNSQDQGNNQNPRSILTNVPGLTGSYADMVRFYKNGNDNFFSVYKLYTAGDKRRDVTFVRKFKSPSNNKYYGLPITNPAVAGDSTPFFNKTWDPGSTSITNQSAANVAILRYSDILLIHAEAENELNGPTTKAYKSLNRVRVRAGLAPLVEGSLTKDEFREAVYLDRRLEFVFEYHRWFDLIRQKDASGASTFVTNLHAVQKLNAADYHRLYPIPQSEIDINPLIQGHQNPGWE
ncbi:MAG TPA: RagB/SusD family nutrient uptake outer membrane protein [Ohtaekwangia sp.]|uniref:RagB/SusD family nutrient uptake outer membrane protein n=1 Tax=Ohtaekwangia sp. TaxID=2066019 RepID=UPI002F9554E5